MKSLLMKSSYRSLQSGNFELASNLVKNDIHLLFRTLQMSMYFSIIGPTYLAEFGFSTVINIK